MGQIFTILLLGIAATLLFLLAFRWSVKSRAGRDRQRLEDGLKHLFDLEYRGRHGSLASLSGALGVADHVALALVTRMQTQGLLVARGAEFDLTREGERLALQVIRSEEHTSE